MPPKIGNLYYGNINEGGKNFEGKFPHKKGNGWVKVIKVNNDTITTLISKDFVKEYNERYDTETPTDFEPNEYKFYIERSKYGSLTFIHIDNPYIITVFGKK